MLAPMFGMGMTEILVILVVAMLFLGPEKLPEAAKQISKGIRDLRKQTKEFQDTIENDTQIGGAIRDIKSALRGDEIRRPPVRTKPPDEAQPAVAAAIAAATQRAEATPDPAALPGAAAAADAPAAAAAPAPAPVAVREAEPEPVRESEPDSESESESESEPESDPGSDPDAPADSVAAVDDELAKMIRPVTGAVGRGQPS